MFRTIYIVFALQAFSTISRPTPQIGSLITVDTLPKTLKFSILIDWNQGQLYNAEDQSVLLTKPGTTQNTIEITSPKGDIARTVNLSGDSKSCDPVTYKLSNTRSFKFQNDVWSLNNSDQEGWGNFQFHPTSPSSLLGEIKTIESPMYTVAKITTSNNEYVIKYSEIYEIDELYLTALMIVVDKYEKKCGSN
ncbi:hypothetical protein CROQUDRAFT_298818 [Cronartium quercuum f. sp. fusiforme G11]|uniref:Uncharacterized protein n=1 Tax=Cronartium quercuum f. sp. fusiforme G11 TaxID=708437 RepID=A0A9P6T6P7_9BASI|nr:hypothetical protein CROQUDRAFT_298818 [Cronartium quercuum f. sp. fusiforme G11]